MSTHWGYVCQSHDPHLISETWLNHGELVLVDLYQQMRAGTWPVVAEAVPHIGLAFKGEPYSVLEYGGKAVPALPGGVPSWSGPPAWLMEHPRCKVALRSEFGVVIEIDS